MSLMSCDQTEVLVASVSRHVTKIAAVDVCQGFDLGVWGYYGTNKRSGDRGCICCFVYTHTCVMVTVTIFWHVTQTATTSRHVAPSVTASRDITCVLLLCLTETPLTAASGSLKKPRHMIMTLVSGGCHIDFRSRDSLTPMHRAAKRGNYEAIKVRRSRPSCELDVETDACMCRLHVHVRVHVHVHGT